jgi:hypothetical protein
MSDDMPDTVDFDEIVALALAQSVEATEGPGPEVKSRLMKIPRPRTTFPPWVQPSIPIRQCENDSTGVRR